ncbi:protein SENSITIVE TO PROTON RHIZOTOXICITY 1-like isoform X1 [Melia azedarach]|uniref:Protein SENSITIVE TO PROTON RHIZOTOXICITY 1-like isoform X1 n=1 Tax=Melia azedarach TaxID=155640 RepID=A0ACC1XW63_MELAZ|nr:protein SENSITIVE TO PROTON RHIZOTOXICITY 1-like isoform X1 [Melia azedarach]
MSVSIEALAMAGVDCIEYGFYVEDWNHNGNSSPPPHLLADDGDCDGRCQKLLNVGDQSWLLKWKIKSGLQVFYIEREGERESFRLQDKIMSVSIEALAMAGIDCSEWDLDIEKWESDELQTPPPHLLAEQEEEEEEEEEDEVERHSLAKTGSMHADAGE